MTDIEEAHGAITVRDPKGAINRVETPKGFTDLAFRQAVSAFDTAFRTLGKLPSVDDVHEFWARIPKATYAALFVTPEFKQALAYRGVELDDDIGLSMEQTMLLHKLTDFTDKRSLGAKLKDLGIPMVRYTAWMQQEMFKQALNVRTERMFGDAVPLALQGLLKGVDNGDIRHIEKLLEITGRWNPAQQQVEDVKRIVVALVEAVVRHVQDPEIRQAVMEDVQAQVASYTLLEQRQLGS